MIFFIAFILFAYALIAYIRRKYVKPIYKGQTVWITGASSGIGEYLAYEFNRYEADLVISARNVTQLQRVKANCLFPDRVTVIKLDMTDYDQIEKVSDEVIKSLESQGRKLDVLVENAGISMRCEFLEYSFENHRTLFDVNVNGPYRHMQVVVPHMVKNKSGQIVGISSVAGKLGAAYRTSYTGTKHALIGILDSLRTELKPYNVKVCNVMPGYIKTNVSKNALGPRAGEKFGETDENIGAGMDTNRFAKEAVGAIYNKQNEASIGDKWSLPVGIVLRNLCPDLLFKLMEWNAKKQSKAVKQAKKQ